MDLTESIIFPKITSNCGNTFLIVDHAKNLEELNKSKLIIINQQNDLYYYKKIKSKIDAICYALTAIRFFIPFF